MLSWNFVKAHPITYRATDGGIGFEVTVGADNRHAITVTRTEGDKFEIKTFPIMEKRCGGVKNIRGGMNPLLVFSVYDQPSHCLRDNLIDFG